MYRPISDTSDAPFTIAGPRAFSDSFKRATPGATQGGEITTYTIALLSLLATTHQQWISPPLSSSMVGRSIYPSR